MKRSIAIIALASFVLAAAAAAPAKPSARAPKVKPAIAASGTALGAFLGEPTGLSLRMGISRTESIEARAAWSFGGSSAIHLEANWDFEFPGLIVLSGEQFIPYLGGGAFLSVGGSSLGLGVQVPAGIVYRFSGLPLELALEVDLGLSLLPSTAPVGGGGLAVRWRF